MLETICSQAEFGALVGISQQAVSGMLEREVIRRGDTAGQWLLAYCAHLREQAAGRDPGGELAFQRSELARVSRERAEIKLALERLEYAPVALLSSVLAQVGRTVAGALEPLHANLHKLCPNLTPEGLKHIQIEVARVCDIAVSASLDALDVSEGAAGADIGGAPVDEPDGLDDDDLEGVGADLALSSGMGSLT